MSSILTATGALQIACQCDPAGPMPGSCSSSHVHSLTLHLPDSADKASWDMTMRNNELELWEALGKESLLPENLLCSELSLRYAAQVHLSLRVLISS